MAADEEAPQRCDRVHAGMANWRGPMLAGALRLQVDGMVAICDMALGLALGSRMQLRAARVSPARPVITLPGFAAPARSQAAMSRFLAHCGFDVTTFEPGFPSTETVPQFVRGLNKTLGELIKKKADEYGCGVSIIGQSAGGLYSREYVACFAEDIDRVITLGAPTADPRKMHRNNRALEYLVKRISGAGGFEALSGEHGLLHWPADLPQIPFVAVCSPIDGAIAEDTALIPAEIVLRSTPESPRENLRVRCSHFGMSFNPFIFVAVADRLAQDRSHWVPFDPSVYFPGAAAPLLKAIYPAPS